MPIAPSSVFGVPLPNRLAGAVIGGTADAGSTPLTTLLTAPAGSIYESIPGRVPMGTVSPLSTTRPSVWCVYLPAGTVVSALKIFAGGAGSGLTHAVAALFDATTRAKLAESPDDTTLNWTANTPRTFTFAVPYTVTVSGMFLVALAVSGTTPPGLNGSTGLAAIMSEAPFLSATTADVVNGVFPDPLGASASAVIKVYFNLY